MTTERKTENAMDFFGIGAAVRGAVHIYFQSARGTGRTSTLVESLKDGDRVVFTNQAEARRVERLLRDRGVEAECIVVSMREPGAIFKRGTSQGRTILDHTWVEQFYLNALEDAQRHLAHLERESSGYGRAHEATRDAAREISKWIGFAR